jgi:hypothetical protein
MLLAASTAPVDFMRDVRPILEKRCYSCHGESKQKSGLRLDIKAAAFKGGEHFGPSIVSGRPKESPLLKFVADENADLRMPPAGERLTAAEIATLSQWIADGAEWPEGVDRAKVIDRRDHWSFKPVAKVVPPAVYNSSWPRNAVDRFILARLDKQGLRQSPEASRTAWLRRAAFDLVGLPPTPEQTAAFLADASETAYERVVDELLASPRYGERWAQHWLDVVRYADTHGFEVNTERLYAWPYRDYVIRSFNDDKPYDRFVREQIVGDALGEDAATGFLVTASVLLPGQIGADEPSKRLARQDAIDEIVVNVSQTFLGLSVGCARCHDHKFDPISQRDYYAMQAFVAGVEYGDRELRTVEADAKRAEEGRLQNLVKEIDRRLAQLAPIAQPAMKASANSRFRPPVNPKINTDRFAPVAAKKLRFTIRSTNNLEPCLDEVEVFDVIGANVARPGAGAKITSSGDTVVADRHELRFVNDGEYGNSRSWMSNEVGKGWVSIEFARERTIDRVVWGRDRQGQFSDRMATDYLIEVADASGKWRTVADSSDRAPFTSASDKAVDLTAGLTTDEAKKATQWRKERQSLEAKIAALAEGRLAFAGTFRIPDDIHLLSRGDPEQPKDRVAPAILSALGSNQLPADSADLERRRMLADWIADPDNPLTVRVIVNRIWQGHFGVGLVETASDFGNSGLKPSHPELLDWLASEFVRSGWSIKRLHRLIVLSTTYRQASHVDAKAAAVDSDVRLLWRFPTRRLEAEALRDSMLAISGTMHGTMYGRGFNLFDKRGGLTGFNPVESFVGDGRRRMIYAHKVRRERDGVFGAFDCPDAGQSAARRRESTTPIQALNLFNSRFTLEQADAFARRVRSEVGDDIFLQIDRAYRLAVGRPPETDEVDAAASVVRDHGLHALCRALFNCNEALFLP